MTDYVWPSNLVPNESEWRLVDFTGAHSNPFGGAVRTVSRGQRWACTLRFFNVGGRTRSAQRQQLLALVAALRGRANRVWMPDVASPLYGSFPCPELIANSFPVSTVSPWTSSNAELVLRADQAQGLRCHRDGVALSRNAQHPVVTVVSGARYAFRGLFLTGRGAMIAGLRVGTSAGGNQELNGAPRTASGRYVETLAASGTTAHPNVYDDVTGRSAGDFFHVSALSLARCARVHTTAAAGASAMIVKDLVASTAAQALAGDLFEVGGELHRLVANLDGDASGIGYAMFEPALRTAQAADVPVIFRDPMGRFLLAEEAVWSNAPGGFSAVSLTLVEA